MASLNLKRFAVAVALFVASGVSAYLIDVVPNALGNWLSIVSVILLFGAVAAAVWEYGNDY